MLSCIYTHLCTYKYAHTHTYTFIALVLVLANTLWAKL